MSDYNKRTDFELLVILKTDDPAAFSELFLRYNRLLFVHAYKLLGDREDARDLVQEIFVMLWDNRRDLAVRTNFGGFLYTLTRNRILDKLAHKKVQAKYFETIKNFPQMAGEHTDHLLRINELKRVIEREISFLPPKMQEIFSLSRNEHLSHREIAERLDISEKTVKNQVNNALKILKSKLGRSAL